MSRKLLPGRIVLMVVIALLIMACLALAAPVVVDTVTVNTGPCGIAVNPAGNRVFVTHQGQATNNFTVIRTTDDVVENVFTVGDDPSGIDVNTLTNKVYVANWNSNDIAVRSGSDGSQVHPNIFSPGNPYRVAVSEHLNRVYVTNNIANQVTVLEGVSDTIMATIPLTEFSARHLCQRCHRQGLCHILGRAGRRHRLRWQHCLDIRHAPWRPGRRSGGGGFRAQQDFRGV